MNTKLLAGVASLAMMAAAGASAQSLSYGVALTSDYISRGTTQTQNGAAIQPWFEYGNGGFYAGIWASNVRWGGVRDVEIDPYFGYRWTVENTSFDLGYSRYFYVDQGDLQGELYLLVNHEMGDTGAALFAGFHINPDVGISLTNAHLGITIPLVAQLSGSFRLGVAGGATYGDAGVNYAINDNASVDLRVHGGGTLPNPRLVLSTAFSF